MDYERVRLFLQSNVTGLLRYLDFDSTADQVLDILTENKRQHALLDSALTGLDDVRAKV